MDASLKLLSGSQIIHQKLNGPKELPTSGWKEYCPSASWLEQKQIQAHLEDKRATVGVERIEKQTNLAKAEWIDQYKKAKVLKKVGKHWEVLGHHAENEDWLFPEEALYLIEVNVLELFYNGVPVSVEYAYALLLSESHNCTLSEYRVYSSLSRRGYKLIRHSAEVTVTKYEKQIHLDQVLETQKRDISTSNNGKNQQLPQQQLTTIIETSSVSEKSDVSCVLDDSSSITIEAYNLKPVSKTVHTVKEIPSNQKGHLTKPPINDSDDVCIIENDIEIIEIDDGILKKSISCELLDEDNLNESNQSNKRAKTLKNENVIIIEDDDDEDEGENDDPIKEEYESDSSEDTSEDDVILVNSFQLESRKWYKRINRCLISEHVAIVDLSDDNSTDVKVEKDDNNVYSRNIVARKSKSDIINEITNAKSGVLYIKSPNSVFLPKEIVPKYSQYRVNLNMRQQTNNTAPFYRLERRPLQFHNNQTNMSSMNDTVFKQACEMRAMAISMIQAASSLMSSVNTQMTAPIPPLINDMQLANFFNQTNFNNAYNFTPRTPNNSMCNNNSGFFGNNTFNSMRNLFAPRKINYYGRRHFRPRNYRYHNQRVNSPHNNLMSSDTPPLLPTPIRYANRNTPTYHNRNQEVITIDSDDDIDCETKPNKKLINVETPSKVRKLAKTIEFIDLFEEKTIKCESANTIERRKTVKKKQNYPKTDSVDKKPNIDKECKLELQCNIEDVSKKKLLPDMKLKDEINLVMETNKLNPKSLEDSGSHAKIDTKVNLLDMIVSEKESLDSRSESSFYKMEVTLGKTTPESEKPELSIEDTNKSKLNEVQTGVSEKEFDEMEEPTTWQQLKEQSEHIEGQVENDGGGYDDELPLIQPERIKNLALAWKNLHIFESVDAEELPHEKTNPLNISFDAYLPTDHFRKSHKILPKFRIIVVNGTDSLPSQHEINILKSNYQDGIPFLYAMVNDDTITFYLYDTVSLTEYSV